MGGSSSSRSCEMFNVHLFPLIVTRKSICLGCESNKDLWLAWSTRRPFHKPRLPHTVELEFFHSFIVGAEICDWSTIFNTYSFNQRIQSFCTWLQMQMCPHDTPYMWCLIAKAQIQLRSGYTVQITYKNLDFGIGLDWRWIKNLHCSNKYVFSCFLLQGLLTFPGESYAERLTGCSVGLNGSILGDVRINISLFVFSDLQ
jgi:hypothetical protein